MGGGKSSGLKKSQRWGSTPRPTLGSLSLLLRGDAPAFAPRGGRGRQAQRHYRREEFVSVSLGGGREQRAGPPTLGSRGGTPAEQKGAALPGAEQPRLPQTWSARPAPPRHPQNPQPRRESPDPALGACRRPRLCGTERGLEASVPAGICPCSPRSAGGGRDAMCPVPARAEMERALGEPCGDGSSEMLDFIHRVQENMRDTAQGAGDKCFAAVWSKDCEGKVLWLVLP